MKTRIGHQISIEQKLVIKTLKFWSIRDSMKKPILYGYQFLMIVFAQIFFNLSHSFASPVEFAYLANPRKPSQKLIIVGDRHRHHDRDQERASVLLDAMAQDDHPVAFVNEIRFAEAEDHYPGEFTHNLILAAHELKISGSYPNVIYFTGDFRTRGASFSDEFISELKEKLDPSREAVKELIQARLAAASSFSELPLSERLRRLDEFLEHIDRDTVLSFYPTLRKMITDVKRLRGSWETQSNAFFIHEDSSRMSLSYALMGNLFIWLNQSVVSQEMAISSIHFMSTLEGVWESMSSGQADLGFVLSSLRAFEKADTVVLVCGSSHLHAVSAAFQDMWGPSSLRHTRQKEGDTVFSADELRDFLQMALEGSTPEQAS